MIYVNVLLTVKSATDIETVRTKLVTLGELSRAEPGCARFEVYHSTEDRQFFILSEHWQTQEDLDRHRQAQPFTEIYQPQVLPLVDRVPHPADKIS